MIHSKITPSILLILIWLSPVFAGANILSDIQSLKPGCWYEIANTRLKDAAYSWSPNPLPGVFFKGIMVAWNGGVFDTKRNQLLIFGGGHTDYGGNEIYGFDFDDFQWHLIADPSSYKDIMAHQATKKEDKKKYYPDGRPVSRHSQNYIVYHPQWDALVSVGYRGGYRLPDESNLMDYFDLSAGRWVTNSKKEFPGTFSKCVDVDVSTGNLWVYALRNDRALWEYDHVKDAWHQRHPKMSSHGWDPYTILKIDPQKRKCLVLGNGKYFVYDISRLNYKKNVELETNVSKGPQAPVKSGQPTIAFDSLTGYMLSWIGGTSVYAVKLGNNIWTEIKASATNKVVPTKRAYGGTYGRWQYVPDLNVFALVNSTDENVFVYKFLPDKPDVVAPDIQQFSMPKFSNSKTFKIKAAARDDVGIVGYIITQTKQIPEGNDPSWISNLPNTWSVPANGTYYFFLWAKDLAGNISLGKKQTITVNADNQPPRVTRFTISDQTNGLDIPIKTLHAEDNIAVVAYQITESDRPPSKTSSLWRSDPPKSYRVSGCGELTLYAWAKDAEGNMSNTSSHVSILLPHTHGALLVGPRHPYQTISSAVKDAKQGDVIEVDAGLYENDTFIIRANQLTIRGVGGYAHIKGTQKIGNGKGLIVQKCDNLFLENLELSGAKVSDKNGAGVRTDQGSLTIQNCYIHNNENGILAGKIKGGKFLIEDSIFDANGDGTGFTHNIYIGKVDSLILRNNIIQNAKTGHNIKSRAANNIIESNAILELKNQTSYAIDLPNGGLSRIDDNIIHQGLQPKNSSIISYKQDKNRPWNQNRTLSIENNIIIDENNGRSYIIRSGIGTKKILFKNNLVLGDKKDLLWKGKGEKPEEKKNVVLKDSKRTHLLSSFIKNFTYDPSIHFEPDSRQSFIQALKKRMMKTIQQEK